MELPPPRIAAAIFWSLAALVYAAASSRAQPAPREAALNDTPILQIPMMEMVVPEPPRVLHAGGRRSLCYEVFITNMFVKPFAIDRVRVLTGEGAELLDSQGKVLKASLERASKAQPADAEAPLLKQGERDVFFAFVELPDGSPAPATIKHEIGFKPEKSDGLTIHGEEVPVKDDGRTIQPPLRGENWVAFNGPGNVSGHRRAMITLDGVTWIAQRYAIDWVKAGKNGMTFEGNEKENARYYCYGEEAHAVADAMVTAVKDGLPENIPGAKSRAVPITLETIGGNHVILDLGGGVFAFYAHLQPGKIRVKVGDRVKAGDVLGLVGNSGNSSEPHLHFQLCDRNSPLASQGLPYAFRQFAVTGHIVVSESGIGEIKSLDKPETRRDEMPLQDEVISFAAPER